MRVISTDDKNFNNKLENLLDKRKKKLKSNLSSVSKIIQDVKKNGDKALLKYEKKFNKNKIIVPSVSQISQSIIQYKETLANQHYQI